MKKNNDMYNIWELSKAEFFSVAPVNRVAAMVPPSLVVFKLYDYNDDNDNQNNDI